MGSKISFPAPRVTSKPVTAKADQCSVEKKKDAKPAAPSSKDTFEAKGSKPGTTYQKIESIWKDGNVTGTDDWQKLNN